MAVPRPPPPPGLDCPHDRDGALPRTNNIVAVLLISAKHTDNTGKEAKYHTCLRFVYPLVSTPNVVNVELTPTPGLRIVPGLRVFAVAQFNIRRLPCWSRSYIQYGHAVAGRPPQATIATGTLWWYMSRPSASGNYRNRYPLCGTRPRRMNAQERHSRVVRLPRGPGHLEHISTRVRRRGRAQARHVARSQQVYNPECLE